MFYTVVQNNRAENVYEVILQNIFIMSLTFKKPSYATKYLLTVKKAEIQKIITQVNIIYPQQRSHIWMSLYSLIYIYRDMAIFLHYNMTGLLLSRMCYITFLHFYVNEQTQAFFLHFIFCSMLFGQVLCATHLSLLISFSFIFLYSMPASSNCFHY